MNESGGDDYSGAEVAGEEVDVERDLEPSDAHRKDGEEGDGGGDNENDEDGGDASAEPAIVVIGRGVEVAEYRIQICSVEVDSLGVEAGSHFDLSFFLSEGLVRGGCLAWLLASPGR